MAPARLQQSAGKRRQRSGGHVAHTATKRQCNRKISDGMPVTKKVDGARGHVPSTTPCAVLNPRTTMDAVHCDAQPTSVETIQSSGGLCATIYSTKETSKIGSADLIPLLTPHLCEDVSDAQIEREIAQDDHDHGEGLVTPPSSFLKVDSATTARVPDVNHAPLPTPLASDATCPGSSGGDGIVSQPASSILRPHAGASTTVDDHEDVETREDEEFIEWEKATKAAEVKALRPRSRGMNIHAVDANEDYGGALLSLAEKQLLSDARAAAARHTAVAPIVRTPFPPAIRDRSSIFGASRQTLLRTCFRIGEALNAGTQAVRTNRHVVLELYARVMQSWREPRPGRKQHFIFHDLYHDQTPHLDGCFELWDQSQLWDMDSKVFLTARKGGMLCRVIAKMRRNGAQWRLEVLSIWQACWEDVEHVAGVYVKG